MRVVFLVATLEAVLPPALGLWRGTPAHEGFNYTVELPSRTILPASVLRGCLETKFILFRWNGLGISSLLGPTVYGGAPYLGSHDQHHRAISIHRNCHWEQ